MIVQPHPKKCTKDLRRPIHFLVFNLHPRSQIFLVGLPPIFFKKVNSPTPLGVFLTPSLCPIEFLVIFLDLVYLI